MCVGGGALEDYHCRHHLEDTLMILTDKNVAQLNFDCSLPVMK